MKDLPNKLQRWTTTTAKGVRYGCRIIDGNNGKVIDVPGQIYKSRSGRRKWINKKLAADPEMIEEKINPPKK